MLILKPKRKRLEKRVSRVLLWVGDQDFLPRALKYEAKDGDTVLLSFRNLETNVALADGVFHLDVPDDVEVSDEITMFSAGGAR